MLTQCPLSCGYEGELSTFKNGICPKCKGITKDFRKILFPNDEVSKKEDIQPRSTSQKVAYISFRVIGLIAILSGFLVASEISGSGGATGGLAGVLGIGILVPLGIPLFLSIILGPGLSLFVGLNDSCLMSMTGLTILFLILSVVVGAVALAPLFFAYGIACMAIGAKWIPKMNAGSTPSDSQN